METIIPRATNKFISMIRESIEGTASVGISGYSSDNHLRVDNPYDLTILFSPSRMDELRNLSILAKALDIRLDKNLSELTVVPFCSVADIEPPMRRLIVNGNNEVSSTVLFTLIPRSSGMAALQVDFYYANRWLQKLSAPVEVAL